MTTATQPIINTILSDINAVIPNFSSLVSSYRLLVGAAEEIRRTPGVPFEIFERAVIRYDRTGTLIDILLELLCCKITFSSQFLSIICAPIDLIRLLADCGLIEDDSCRTAELIIILEALRQVLGPCFDHSCFGPPPEGITPPPPPAPPEATTPPAPPAPPTPPTRSAPPVNPYPPVSPGDPCPPKQTIIQSDIDTLSDSETEVTPFRMPLCGPLSRRHI